MSVFKCKMCGGALEIGENQTTAVCEYCGTQQTLPRLEDERRANLYDRANHFRRGNEFDKAMGIYESILNETPDDAEAYWSLVLCKYGIEYVEDPKNCKRIPTVNRTQFTSIYDDDNYKSALQFADSFQRKIYEEEANTINEIQKNILAISQNEKPFDVFICYKETDKNGRRTPDSVLANDLYHQLIQEGFKVFFARITLEDKLGTAYEPYIFAALNSAKVMVVLGTKPEYFNAVWVKNEWSRYLSLVKASNGKKVLIPAYKDMDPYDLPEEFSHLQAQDMSKLGFMQDLIRGIKKLTEQPSVQKEIIKETVISSDTAATANIGSLLERAFMFLEDREWAQADEYCEKVLDMDARNAKAYFGKLMAELKCDNPKSLNNCPLPFDGSANYQKAVRFGDENLKKALTDCTQYIKSRNEQTRLSNIYNEDIRKMEAAKTENDFLTAAKLFESIKGFKDSEEKAKECFEKAEVTRKDELYRNGITYKKDRTVTSQEEAIKTFSGIADWKDSKALIEDCKKTIEELKTEAKRRAKKTKKIVTVVSSAVAAIVAVVVLINAVILPTVEKEKVYKTAIAYFDEGSYNEAVRMFTSLNGYKDSEEKLDSIYKKRYDYAQSLYDQGNYLKALEMFRAAGDYSDDIEKCREIFAFYTSYTTISASDSHSLGLTNDGTVVAVGSNNYGQCNVSGWKDIVSVSAGNSHTVGLKPDGSVVATGGNTNGQCNVSDWKNIVAVSAGYSHTIGLKAGGTVVAVGANGSNQCNVSGWKDLIAVSAGNVHTVGLKKDGTVVAVGENGSNQCNVSCWKDIVAVSAGANHTVGLKRDGTVVAVGSYYYGQRNVSDWKDIVAVSAGSAHTVGLKADGTVVATGDNQNGQCNVSAWKDIVAVSAGDTHTVGLKADGTVVAVGANGAGQCDVSGWTNMKVPGGK